MESYLVVTFFCLIGVFFLSSSSLIASLMGESLVSQMLRSSRSLFVFRPIYLFFDKKERFHVLTFALRITNHIGRILFTLSAALWIYTLPPHYHYFIKIAFALAAVFLLLIVGDIAPRAFARQHPSRRLRFLLPVASIFLLLALPITAAMLFIAQAQSKKERLLQGENPLLEIQKEIMKMLQDSNINQRLDPLDLKLIESVLKFRERIVREVMIPRVDLFALPAGISIGEASKQILEEGYSRIPVYRDNIDNITGLLMFKDVLEIYMQVHENIQDPSILEAPIESITKSVFYVPETKQVSYLLQEFRAKQMHMAIVVDEYGGTEGVVTMEDILEEIVGEIADEYDFDVESLYKPLPAGGGWIVDARMSLIDAEEHFGIQIPQEGDYDTIGGYVFHTAGEIPEKGYLLHHEQFDLEVLSSTQRSVEKLRITLRDGDDESDPTSS